MENDENSHKFSRACFSFFSQGYLDDFDCRSLCTLGFRLWYVANPLPLFSKNDKPSGETDAKKRDSPTVPTAIGFFRGTLFAAPCLQNLPKEYVEKVGTPKQSRPPSPHELQIEREREEVARASMVA